MTGAENVHVNSNNIIFTIIQSKLFAPVVILSANNNKKLLSKGFERSVYWNEFKIKSESKNATNKYRYILHSNVFWVNRVFVLSYLNRDLHVKQIKVQRYYL